MARPNDDGKSRDEESHYRRAALSQPLRRRIVRRLADAEEAGAAELAAELGAPLGRVAYHLGVLLRRGVVRAESKGNPAPHCRRYRWRSDAQWARDMLAEEEGEGP